MRHILLACVVLILLAQPADAFPAIGAAIAAAWASITLTTVLTFVLKTVVGIGISLLLNKKKSQDQKQPGAQTTITTAGGTDPQGTIVGKYLTAGHFTYRNSHGANNRYLTHLIEVSDLPGVTLSRLVIDAEYSELGPVAHPDYGFPILTKNDGTTDWAWIKFSDGTHTTADAKMVQEYGNDTERPWTGDHVLSGIVHAVLTFDRNTGLFKNGVPDVKFELNGIALYDPRADSSVGGSGAQRWGDPATWGPTVNPLVIAYNIHRGLTLPTGEIWGGDAEAEDMPLTSWVPAFNVCDLVVGDPVRPQFTAGYEIRFQDEPADILDDLYAAANAQVTELGGVWTIQAGAPPAAIAHISDDDILISKPQDFDPFPSLDETYNRITVSHPSPNVLWNPNSKTTDQNAIWEGEDRGQRLFELILPTVYSAQQARQIANNMVRDGRRMRAHSFDLPPDYFYLETLHGVTWTSGWNGYADKHFEITERAYDLRTLTSAVSLRERDPSDFDFEPGLELPDPPAPLTPISVVDAGVPDFAATGLTILGASGEEAYPVLSLTWDGDIAQTASALTFELRVVGQTETWKATTADVASGAYQLRAVMPGTAYQVRSKTQTATRVSHWGAWLSVTTPGVILADVEDLTFEHNDPTINRVSWTTGEIKYFDASGTLQTRAIAADDKIWSSGIQYIYWIAGENILRITSIRATAYVVNAVVLAAYAGGTRLTVYHGKKILDGSDLKVGTLRADAVDTTDFHAAGAAIFGGTLGSGNYNPAAPDATREGWHISADGSAEFNDMVVRRWLQDGAASDGGIAEAYATPIRKGAETASVPVLSKWLGATIGSQFWHFACSIELSGEAAMGNTTTTDFAYRTKTGGVWSGWSTFHDPARVTATSWTYFSHVAHFNGVFDNVQIGIFVDPNRNLSFWGVDNVRNAAINARALMR